MSKTANIFGKSYGVFKMSHADKAVAWIQNAPEADIHIGRFTLKFKFIADQDWGWDWDLTAPDNFEDTPEDKYYEEIYSNKIRELLGQKNEDISRHARGSLRPQHI